MKQLHPDTLISTASIVTRHDSFAVGSSVTSNIICRAGLAGCLLAWSNVKLLVIVLFVYTLNMCFPAPSTTTHISNEVLIVWKHYLQLILQATTYCVGRLLLHENRHMQVNKTYEWKQKQTPILAIFLHYDWFRFLIWFYALPWRHSIFAFLLCVTSLHKSTRAYFFDTRTILSEATHSSHLVDRERGSNIRS